VSPDARRRSATALVVAAALLLLAASLVGYARLALLSSGQFADRAAATVREPAVRTLVAEQVTDKLVLRSEPNLLAGRALIVSAVSGIVGGSAFATLVQRAALDAHRAVFERDQDTILLTLVDVGTVAGTALEKVRPDLAAKLESEGPIVLLKRRLGGLTGDLARAADRIRVLALLLAGLTLAAAAAALAISPDRRSTASRLGLGMAAAGAAIVIGYPIARHIALAGLSDPADRAAAGAVWQTFLGDLRTLGWVLAGAGAVVAAAAASLIQPVDVEAPLRRLWRIATTRPATTPLRLVRAAALIALGILVIGGPQLALQAAATLGGVYLLFKGIEEILRLIYRPASAPQPVAAPRRRRRRGAVFAVAAVLIAGAVAAFLAGGGVEAPAAAITRCNGYAELCDRPLDDVVLPATHNSMSAPLPGWNSAEQERGIGDQLADGIRGLLLDTHYADKLANGRIRTAFGDAGTVARVAEQDGISQEAVDAALRLRERLGYRGKGERGMYLCHTFCELGATPLPEVLTDMHDFLATHQQDVVVMVNQDYVTPADFVNAVDDAGLSPYVFTPPAGSAWPTLREMISSGRRLIVLAENHAGAAPWYQLAYQRLTEETPYTFPKPALLTHPADLPPSCEPNRGPAKAPLFLINHWVSTDPIPLPRDAATVNAYAPLLRRARECQRLRHHLPNLLAVNFYKQGDLFRVVDTLNGVG
jgi:hypothetical protein